MATWGLLGALPPLPPHERRLVPVRRVDTRQAGWIWVGGPAAGAARAPGTEPGSELVPDRRVWATRADAELGTHLGLLDDDGEVTGA